MSRYGVIPNGDLIRSLRLRKGWKQDAFAKEANCGKRTIGNIESNKPCNLWTLQRIASALGVSVGRIKQSDVPREPPLDKPFAKGTSPERSIEERCWTDPRHPQDLIACNTLGLYLSSRAAIAEIASAMPKVDEVAFVAYVATIYTEDLRSLTSTWQIHRFRLLLRDPDAINTEWPGEIPCDARTVKRRRREITDNIRDLTGDGPYAIEEPIEVRYYRSQPCLCGLLVRGQENETYSAGFLSICRERTPKGTPVDYSPMLSPILRLSSANWYETRSWRALPRGLPSCGQTVATPKTRPQMEPDR